MDINIERDEVNVEAENERIKAYYTGLKDLVEKNTKDQKEGE